MADLNITNARPVEVVEQFTGPLGEAATSGTYGRYNTTTGRIEKGNATNANEAKAGGILISGGVAGQAVTAVKRGVVDVGNALDALAYDAPVYLSDTDGKLADAPGTVNRQVGKVVPAWGNTTADKLLQVEL